MMVASRQLFVPSRQPIVDHDHALFSQQVAQANGDFPHAHARHDAGPQYPCQISIWNDTAFNAYHSGDFNPNDAFYGTPSNFSYDGTEVQSAFPMAPMVPVWDLNNIEYFDQLDMSIPAPAQLNPAHYSAIVSAPPAPVPAPVAAGQLRCPRGCSATFGRGGEYRRHMMIHEPARYRCPMVDCTKTFSRADKLRDHAKKGHGGRNPLNL